MSHLEDLTTQCIRCGFCLEDCPTFTQTGNELDSPRGRIYLVRSVVDGKLNWDDVKPHLDKCLGCRACETACPSGVQYGQILEIARDQIGASLVQKAFLTGTTNPLILKTQLAAAKFLPGKRMPKPLSQLLSGASPEVDLPKPQETAAFPDLPKVEFKGEVYMLQGCAMQVLFPRVHQCTERLLHRVGYQIKPANQGCCGALHAHNGQLDEARKLAANLIKSMPGEAPIIVNSAGCGSTMKEYVHLLGTSEAERFAKRTVDLSEFLLENNLSQLLTPYSPLAGKRITYHDACHLSHGQKITSQPRQLIQSIPGIEFVELDESMVCCGSAGIYNVMQPDMARQLLVRKTGHIQETRADIVATGNPGCHAWIAQGCLEKGIARTLHTAELLEAAFVGLEPFIEQ
ncbi:MAG: (Fe-S)-binding protein [Armatimonadota bacterium]